MDYKALFSNNFFTRAQVDILVRLAEMIRADAGGGGGMADPTKVDKTTQIITQNGIKGGGDLSTSRILELDVTFTDDLYPRLVDGKISAAVLPSFTVTDTFTAASEAAMLALPASKGDFCVRTDISQTFILSAEPASELANWIQMQSGTGVSSFNGRTGTVAPQAGDYTFAMLSGIPTTLAGYGITDAEPAIAPHIDGAAKYYGGNKQWNTLDKAAVGLGNVDNTSDNQKPLGTTQLSTLAAAGGLALSGTAPSGVGAITRDAATVVHELGLSLRHFAQADGTDETTRVTNWLNELIASGRRGYVPAGDYRIGEISVSTDWLHVECHPNARFIGVGASINPLIKIVSAAGTSTAHVGTVSWRGGRFLLDARATTVAALHIENMATVTIAGVKFTGKPDYEQGIAASVGGTGISTLSCDNVTVTGSVFEGLVESGVRVRGGTASAITDDGIGILIADNHFAMCQYGVRAERAARSVKVSNNSFDRCLYDVAALDADAVRAGLVSVTGNIHRSTGRSAVYLRQARGAVVADNTITDIGYKVDSVTPVGGTVVAIHLLGAYDVNVNGNTVRMGELARLTDTHGVRLEKYTFSGIDQFCEQCFVHGNLIRGMQYAVSDDGTSIDSRHRNNKATDVDAEYNNVPALHLAYGDYTPICTAVANIAAVSGMTSKWHRVERDIIVYFAVQVDPTASGAAEFEMSLPVDPTVDFGADIDLIGHGYSDGATTGARLVAKTAARVARVLLNFPSNSASQELRGTLTYRIGSVLAAPPPPPPPPDSGALTDESGNLITTETGDSIIVA